MGKKSSVAINATELTSEAGVAPEWVLLIPGGQVLGRDGRSWSNERPEAIIAGHAQLGRDLPIDIEHSSEHRAPKGEPAPAVGWIKELAVRDGGEIWGRVEWNADGQSLVGGKSYRYLSPVIVYEQGSGAIVGLLSAALTNQPNFKLPALNRQESEHEGASPEEERMLKALLAALGLPETGTEQDAVTKIGELKTDLATATNRAENPSLEKFVPRADYDQALARATNAEQALAEEKKQKLDGEIETAVNQALTDGKITPATADYYKAQCRQEGGLEAFKKFCEAAPVIGDPSNLDGKDPANGAGTALNAAEKEVCERMGVSEDEYRKTTI